MFSKAFATAISVLILTTTVCGKDKAAHPDIRHSVVKIFATQHEPDPLKPWTKLSPMEVSGTGIVIEGNRILTNAHVVIHARQVYVQAFQSADRYRANVIEAATGPDLAVLELRDASFFETHPPAPFAAELPTIGDDVDVYGYPMGGEALSVTKGVVSRIEFADYFVVWQGLLIQIDAAINPGNSGGPAVSGDVVIGLTFSTLDDAENIGYVVPVEEILAFLNDLDDGSYEGRPQLFDTTQTLANPALRAKLKLDKSMTGVMVTKPAVSDPDYPLRPWDVLTAIGGHDIDNEGMVKLSDDLRLLYLYLVPHLVNNGTVPLSIRRGGKPLTVHVPVQTQPNKLVRYLGAEAPSYFIYGPFVFSPVYADLTDLIIEAEAAEYFINSSSPIATRGASARTFDGEELVIAPTLFPHEITHGYESAALGILESVNGIKIKNLRHLVRILRTLDDEFVTFLWADSATETMVFRRSEITEATEEVLEVNGIRAQYSKDLRDVWAAAE